MLWPWRAKLRRPTLHDRLAALRAEREQREDAERDAAWRDLQHAAREALVAGEERRLSGLVHGCEIVVRPLRHPDAHDPRPR